MAAPPSSLDCWTERIVGNAELVDEPACKPGPVPGCLAAIPFGDHPSRRAVADTLQRSTRRLGRAALERLRTVSPDGLTASRPCFGWGLPSRPGHPGRWWSLTPPFHPHRRARRRPAVCFLWHCPAARAGLSLTTTLPCEARTFLGGRPLAGPTDAAARPTHPVVIVRVGGHLSRPIGSATASSPEWAILLLRRACRHAVRHTATACYQARRGVRECWL